MKQDLLPSRPGGLAEAERAVQRNDVYNTKLRLIFYDEPTFGHYQERFDKIFSDRRYTDLRTNLTHFEDLYATILSHPPAKTDGLGSFEINYRHAVAAEKAKLDEALRVLSAIPGQRS
jgi:hypothetical protein